MTLSLLGRMESSPPGRVKIMHELEAVDIKIQKYEKSSLKMDELNISYAGGVHHRLLVLLKAECYN